MSYSNKISDPRFDKYIKNTRDYRYQFGFILAIVAVVGFYLYGKFSDEMDNPEALYIGLTIGAMFFLIGLYAAFSGKKIYPLGMEK
jgi:peptidoglycan/LPS O-acetylase OafA/YrhL